MGLAFGEQADNISLKHGTDPGYLRARFALSKCQIIVENRGESRFKASLSVAR